MKIERSGVTVEKIDGGKIQISTTRADGITVDVQFEEGFAGVLLQHAVTTFIDAVTDNLMHRTMMALAEYAGLTE